MEHMTAMSGEAALELGRRLGGRGMLTVGAEGGELAWMLARTAGCGASLSGGDVLFHDGTTPAAGAWLASHYALSASLFFLEENGQASVWLHDGQGRELEQENLPPPAGWAGPVGTWDRLIGTDASWASHLVGGRQVSGLLVTVMPGPGQGPLATALERLGCEVLGRPRPEVPLLRSDRAGFHLIVRDGMNEERPDGPDAVSAAVEWCLRREQALRTVPAFGPNEGPRAL